MLGERSKRVLYPIYTDGMFSQHPHVGRLRGMGGAEAQVQTLCFLHHAGTYRGHP